MSACPFNLKAKNEPTGLVRRINRVGSEKRRIATAFTITVVALFLGTPLHANDRLVVPIVEKINQYDYEKSVNACGPTCLMMQFQSGTTAMKAGSTKLMGDTTLAKLNLLVDRYFKAKRSKVSTTFNRWTGKGVFPVDLAQAAKDFAEDSGMDRESISGYWMDRLDGEGNSDFIRRIHGHISDSLEAGIPLVLNLRSFRTWPKENEPGEFEWKPARQHFVLISGVQKELINGDQAAKRVSSQGFEVTIVDPVGGMESEIYLFNTRKSHPFMALKGNEIKGHWLSGRPFLEVNAPSVGAMDPANLKWNHRVVVVATHLIGAK